VLLAYAKIDLTDEILDSDLPDDPLLEGELVRYFPTTLQQKSRPQLRTHRLRREIAALQVVNSLVNRCGPTFVRTVGSGPARRRGDRALPSPWCATPGSCAILWGEVEALDSSLKAEAQTRMLVASQRFLLRAWQWTLRRLPQPIDTMAATEHLGGAVAALGDLPSSLIGEAESTALNERAAAFEALGAPPDTARGPRRWKPWRRPATSCWPRGRTAARSGMRHGSISNWASGCRSPQLEAAAHKLPRDGQWPSQAAVAMLDELAALHADLLGSALKLQGDTNTALQRWSGGPEACARAGRPPEGGAGGGGTDRPCHAVGRDQRVCARFLSANHGHIGSAIPEVVMSTKDREERGGVADGARPAAASRAAQPRAPSALHQPAEQRVSAKASSAAPGCGEAVVRFLRPSTRAVLAGRASGRRWAMRSTPRATPATA